MPELNRQQFSIHLVEPDSPYEGGMSHTWPHERALEARVHGDPEQPLGALRFHKDTGRVEGLFVYPEVQRQGIATSLWHEGLRRGFPLQHSDERTVAGDAWAHRVGGPVPPLRRRVESSE